MVVENEEAGQPGKHHRLSGGKTGATKPARVFPQDSAVSMQSLRN